MTKHTEAEDSRVVRARDVFYELKKLLKSRHVELDPLQFEIPEYSDGEATTWYGFDAAEGGAGLGFVAGFDDGDQLLYFATAGIELEYYREEVPDMSTNTVAKQMADFITMMSSGQLAVVASLKQSDETIEAVEMIVSGWQKEPVAIVTQSMHARRPVPLSARLYANSGNTPKIPVPDDFLLLPPKVNGRYVTGREFDISHLTPLHKQEFKKFHEGIPNELVGAKRGEPFWRVAYKTAEFWLVCLSVGVPVVVVLSLLPEDDTAGGWLWTIVRQLVAAAAMFLLIFLSYFALARRQARLDAGKQPFLKPLEDLVAKGFLEKGLMLATVVVAWFFPVWTTFSHPRLLETGWRLVADFPFIGLSLCVLLAAIIMPVIKKRRAALSALFMTAGYGLLLFVNFFQMSTAEDAATPNDILTVCLTVVPVMAIIAAWIRVYAAHRSDADGTIEHI